MTPNPTLPVKIDEVFDDLFATTGFSPSAQQMFAPYLDRAKTALLEAFREAVEEVISKDEPAEFGKSHRPSDVIGLDNARVRNQLREDQRHRLNQILGESNG